MGKNNRCKAKASKGKQFSITPKEMLQAESELDAIIEGKADERAQQIVHDANWILLLMNEYILVKTFRFGDSMLHRYIDERRKMANMVQANGGNVDYEMIEKMYKEIEKVVGSETMISWFAKLPDPESCK